MCCRRMSAVSITDGNVVYHIKMLYEFVSASQPCGDLGSAHVAASFHFITVEKVHKGNRVGCYAFFRGNVWKENELTC